MKKYILGLLLLFAMTITSCKNFLDLYPSESTASGESIKNPGDAQVAINGVYRLMTSSSYYGREMMMYGDFKGGDFGLTTTAIAGDGLYFFMHRPESGSYSAFWDKGYDILLQLNNMIKLIDGGDVAADTENDKAILSDIKGQALALRALVLFDLTRLYGYPYLKDNGASLGVAIVTDVIDYKATLKRNTVAECYTQVIKDLDAAIKILPTPSASSLKYAGSINKYGAQAILSKVYLNMGNWDNAYDIGKSVITSNVYKAYSASDWVISWSKQCGSESIFELLVLPDEADLGLNSPKSYFAPRNRGTKELGCMMASDNFLTMFNQYPDDARWGIFDLDEFSNGKTLPITIPGRKGWMKKYEGDGKFPASAVNIKVIRLTEVLLNTAEAAVKKTSPDMKGAAEWINLVRRRNPILLPLTEATPKNVMLDEILLETRKDLIGEGHLYFAILRNGGTINYVDGGIWSPIPNGGRGSSVNWNYEKCILPIGLDEMNANPAIKDQQNPGY